MPTSRALPGALALLLWLVSAPPGFGVEFDVNTGRDGADVNLVDDICDVDPETTEEICTLRAAVQNANKTPGEDQINLESITYQLSIAGAGEDAAATGDLDVTTPIVITSGDGSFATTVIDGKKSKDRVFDVKPTGALTLIRLSVMNGRTAKEDFDPGAPGEVSGGCVRSEGELTTPEGDDNDGAVFFSACSSSDDGGCVTILAGTALLEKAIFGECRAKNEGGAVEVGALGSATLSRVTLFGNRATTGGAIASSGALELRNVTLDFNKAKVGGGVAALGAGATLINSSTLTANGGGNIVRQGGGTVTVSNTIVAYGKTGCAGAITSAGGNLEDGDSCGFAGTNDQQNVDPLLFGLNFFGGAVPTRALDRDSPAIDHGLDASCEVEDAREEPRDDVVDVGIAICDSGSFEFFQP
jgi:predicted outer membrane repeat protein